MKLIRMTRTMASPAGIRTAGSGPYTVSDDEAAMLVAAGAAELVATITDREIGHVLTPDREVATVDPVDEAAVRKPAHRKRQKATK
ncbi:MAG: hypothetical protein KC547_08260 [Anaerolineae bacterium]|nr:hypothetical protein [Anaerolineae bacterium]